MKIIANACTNRTDSPIILISCLLIDNACYDYLHAIRWIWFKPECINALHCIRSGFRIEWGIFFSRCSHLSRMLFASVLAISMFFVKFTVAPRITKNTFFLLRTMRFSFRCNIFFFTSLHYMYVAKCVLFRIQYHRTFVNWMKIKKATKSRESEAHWKWRWNSYNSYRRGK